jgi:hypothetical protein
MPVISTIAAATARAFGAFKSAAGGAADEFFNYVTLLLHGDGTNGAQNNSFQDSSVNNFGITRNGNTTQGTFSPFSQTGWSNYFDGSGDYLDSAPGAIGTGDFTLECWVYFNSLASDQGILDTRGNSNTSGFALLGRSTGQISMADGTSLIGTAASASANTWIHVAASRASGVISFYVNGTRSGSTVANTTNFSNNRLRIGAIGSAGENLAGYVSNARLLTSAIYSGTTITVPTTPLTAITNTSLLTCQSNRFRDASTNNFAITVNGNTSVQAFSPFAPTAAYSAATVGGSGYFDGSGDYLTVPDDTALEMGSSNFTMECWFYPLSLPADALIADFGSQGAQGSLIPFYCSSSNLVYYISSGGGAWNIASAVSFGGTLRVGQWHHFALVRNGNTYTPYFNGVAGTTTTNSSAINNSAVNKYIGASTPGTAAVNGYISNFRVVKGTAVYTGNFTPPTTPLTAITNTSLLLNFTNGGIIDNTAKNVLETVGNAQISTSVKKYGTGSLAFDGTGDNLLIPDTVNLDFGTGDLTIEFWLYRNNTTDDMAVIDARSGASTGWLIYLGSSNKIIWFVNAGVITGSTTIGSGSWYHIAITKSGTTHRLFVNGVQDGTATNSTSADASIVSIGSKSPGASGSSIVNLNGYIDDLRITKGIARYTSAFTPPTAAFADQ